MIEEKAGAGVREGLEVRRRPFHGRLVSQEWLTYEGEGEGWAAYAGERLRRAKPAA